MSMRQWHHDHIHELISLTTVVGRRREVAVGRIQSFLLGEESTFKPEINPESPFAVEAKDAKFVWKTLPKDDKDGDEKGKQKEKGKETGIELEEKAEKHPFDLDKFSMFFCHKHFPNPCTHSQGESEKEIGASGFFCTV